MLIIPPKKALLFKSNNNAVKLSHFSTSLGPALSSSGDFGDQEERSLTSNYACAGRQPAGRAHL